MRSMQCNVEFGYQLSIRSGSSHSERETALSHATRRSVNSPLQYSNQDTDQASVCLVHVEIDDVRRGETALKAKQCMSFRKVACSQQRNHSKKPSILTQSCHLFLGFKIGFLIIIRSAFLVLSQNGVTALRKSIRFSRTPSRTSLALQATFISAKLSQVCTPGATWELTQG
jgi:hypothetical protein